MLQVLITYSRGRNLVEPAGYAFYMALFNPDLYQDHHDVESMADFFRAIVAYGKFFEQNRPR